MVRRLRFSSRIFLRLRCICTHVQKSVAQWKKWQDPNKPVWSIIWTYAAMLRFASEVKTSAYSVHHKISWPHYQVSGYLSTLTIVSTQCHSRDWFLTLLSFRNHKSKHALKLPQWAVIIRKERPQGILELSLALTWEEAKLEWKLSSMYQVGSPSICLCGHNPIIEICVFENDKTGQFAKVGNRCVKRFWASVQISSLLELIAWKITIVKA